MSSCCSARRLRSSSRCLARASDSSSSWTTRSFSEGACGVGGGACVTGSAGIGTASGSAPPPFSLSPNAISTPSSSVSRGASIDTYHSNRRIIAMVSVVRKPDSIFAFCSLFIIFCSLLPQPVSFCAGWLCQVRVPPLCTQYPRRHAGQYKPLNPVAAPKPDRAPGPRHR